MKNVEIERAKINRELLKYDNMNQVVAWLVIVVIGFLMPLSLLITLPLMGLSLLSIGWNKYRLEQKLYKTYEAKEKIFKSPKTKTEEEIKEAWATYNKETK